MKKPNYGYEKHMKELKRKKKNEAKRQRKLNKGGELPDDAVVNVLEPAQETPPIIAPDDNDKSEETI